MAKVIFFNIPAQGHINPSLPVITELVRRGEQVICVNTAETESQYAATGARFVSTPNTDKLSQLVSQSSGGD
ncbi:MAG: glycosyl transferase, partial [Anaerolineae bacterium]|nr:glycosyl transferase [Anaerolineae bacterium]